MFSNVDECMCLQLQGGFIFLLFLVPAHCRWRWRWACSTSTAPCPRWPTQRTRRARARAGSWRRQSRRPSLTSWTKWRPWARAPRWRRAGRRRWPQWAELNLFRQSWIRPPPPAEQGDASPFHNIYHVDATDTHTFSYNRTTLDSSRTHCCCLHTKMLISLE